MDYLHQFTFGIYPYLAMVIFLLGSLIRFEREQYSWKSESSQVLHMGALRLGNILFHVGILGLFFGHLVGLLTPVAVWDALGVTHTTKQIFSMVAGARFVDIIIPPLFQRTFGKKHHLARQIGFAVVAGNGDFRFVHHLCICPTFGRRRNGRADDLGATHCHFPWRRSQLYCPRLMGV